MQNMKGITVAKFGGTSLGTAYGFERSRDWIKYGENVRVVVASAPGKAGFANRAARHDGVKVTDRLIRIRDAGHPLAEEIGAIETRFSEIEKGLGLVRGVSQLVEEQVILRLQKKDDSLVALGEFLNARLMVNYLNETGVPAVFVDPREMGFTVQCNGAGWIIDRSRYDEVGREVANLANSTRKMLVVPGFYGYDANGATRVFSRGGSDYTAIVIAVAVSAAHLNGTDTDGIRAVEPEVAANAHRIANLTTQELYWLTRDGKFGVFQDRAAEALRGSNITTRVVNTFDPDSEGTLVTATLQNDGRSQIAGIVPRGGNLVSLVGEKIGNALVDEAASILNSSGATVQNVFRDGIRHTLEIANMSAKQGVSIVYRSLVPQ